MNKTELPLPDLLSDSDREVIESAAKCYGFGSVTVDKKKLIFVADPNSDLQTSQNLDSLKNLIAKINDTGKRLPTEILRTFNSTRDLVPLEIVGALMSTGQLQVHRPGLFSFSGMFLELMGKLNDKICTTAISRGAQPVEFPVLVSIDELAKTTVFANFPHFMNFVSTSAGPSNVTSGATVFEPHLNPPQQICRSAVCFHSYINHAGQRLKTNILETASGRAFRHENESEVGLDRMREFTMREIIAIGSQSHIESVLEFWTDFICQLMQLGNLQGRLETATDMFYPDQLENLHFYQKSVRAKVELRLDIPDLQKTIAVASFNCHSHYFSKSYQIELANGEPAFTGCVAFGIERLAYALVAQLGLDRQKWPPALLQFLGLQS